MFIASLIFIHQEDWQTQVVLSNMRLSKNFVFYVICVKYYKKHHYKY